MSSLRLRWVVYLAVGLFMACLVPNQVADAGGSLDGSTPDASQQVLSCATPIAGVELIEQGSLTFFGELHGTEQMPAFLGEVACQLAKRGGPVTVGLELPIAEQAAIDRFLVSPGMPDDSAALLQGSFWRRPLSGQDGRSSTAMAQLIERLRAIRASGADLKVVVFDETRPPKSRDETMASNVEQIIRADAARTFLLFAGNIHARTTQGTPFDPNFLPMGKYLRDAFMSLRSFDAAYLSGTAWVCLSQGCGANNLSGTDSSADQRIELLATPRAGGFAGLYHVGAITASAPAVPP